jgi:hypothetical protein
MLFRCNLVECLNGGLRKAMNVARFGFPPSAGPESGQATAPFKSYVSINSQKIFTVCVSVQKVPVARLAKPPKTEFTTRK